MTTGIPEVNYVYHGKLVRVVDGDTLEVSVDRGFDDHTLMMVRLHGCDTPECRGPERAAGEWVARQVVAFFRARGGFELSNPPGNTSGKQVNDVVKDGLVLRSMLYRRDMYGRALFRVWAGGEDLTQWLLSCGYAWPTDEQGKIVGVRNMDALRLPEGIHQAVREAMA